MNVLTVSTNTSNISNIASEPMALQASNDDDNGDSTDYYSMMMTMMRKNSSETDDSFHSATQRTRKYSEGCREIETVDDSYHHPTSTTTAAAGEDQSLSLRTTFERHSQKSFLPQRQSSLFSTENDIDESYSKNQQITTATTTTMSSSVEPVVTQTLPSPLERSESFLNSLPVANAIPEVTTIANVGTTVTGESLSNSAVATQVTKLSPTTLLQQQRRQGNDRKAGLINVKVFKESPSTKLGIRLQLSKEGHLQIGTLTGFMTDSPLCKGDELLRLDGQNVTSWTPSKALNHLKTTFGWCTILVRNTQQIADPYLCLASVCKRSSSDKVGITLEKKKQQQSKQQDSSPLIIKALNVASPLGGRTIIRVGDEIDAINGLSGDQIDNHMAVNMIRSIPDWIQILVRTKQQQEQEQDDGETQTDTQHCIHVPDFAASAMSLENNDSDSNNPSKNPSQDHHHQQQQQQQVEEGDQQNDDILTPAVATEVTAPIPFDNRNDHIDPSLLSVTITKNHKSDKVGLSLIKLDGHIYIQKVDGMLNDSILKEGMMLLAINNKLTARMTLSEANAFLRYRVGTITILAQNPQGNPKYVQAMVYKKKTTANNKNNNNLVGVSFKGSEGRQLKVCEVRNDGLFVDSCLNVGDYVWEVNDKMCRHVRPKDAVNTIRNSEHSVSILAKTKSKTGVVVARLGSTFHGGCNPNFVVPRSA